MTEFESAVLTAINGLQEQMQEMKSDITGINTRLDKVDTRLDKIENRLDKVENRLDSIESDVAVMKTDITSMKSDITTMQSDIEDIKENTAITRTAANYNGEKIEELATELQKANIIA